MLLKCPVHDTSFSGNSYNRCSLSSSLTTLLSSICKSRLVFGCCVPSGPMFRMYLSSSLLQQNSILLPARALLPRVHTMSTTADNAHKKSASRITTSMSAIAVVAVLVLVLVRSSVPECLELDPPGELLRPCKWFVNGWCGMTRLQRALAVRLEEGSLLHCTGMNVIEWFLLVFSSMRSAPHSSLDTSSSGVLSSLLSSWLES